MTACPCKTRRTFVRPVATVFLFHSEATTMNSAAPTPDSHAISPESLAHTRLKILEEMFGKRYEALQFSPVLWRDADLYSAHTQRLYKRDFGYLSRALQLEYSYRSWRAFPATALDKFADVTATKLTQIKTLFANTTNRLNALMQQNGYAAAADETLSYAYPARFAVPVIAPQTRVYLELLQMLDQILMLSARATLLGVITSAQRNEAEFPCLKAMRAFKMIVESEKRRLFSEANRVQQEHIAKNVPLTPAGEAALQAQGDLTARDSDGGDDDHIDAGLRPGDVAGAAAAIDEAAAAALALAPKPGGRRKAADTSAQPPLAESAV
jgi:hypothetical protein